MSKESLINLIVELYLILIKHNGFKLSDLEFPINDLLKIKKYPESQNGPINEAFNLISLATESGKVQLDETFYSDLNNSILSKIKEIEENKKKIEIEERILKCHMNNRQTNKSELIIQMQVGNDIFTCEKFINLPSPKSAYIAICFNDSPQAEKMATDLKTKLIKSITNLGNDFLPSNPPCGGQGVYFNRCHALDIPENSKLLIVVSDGTSSNFSNPDVLNWNYKNYGTLPVLKTGNTNNLPSPFNNPNAVFWNNDIDEVIPTIFGLIGISDEDQKIFISYRRTDTSDFAEQLFNRLSHEGFEVFLDRFSINPSVNFQNRLYQELADKAMIILIESANYQKSEWVQYEIDFAKKYRLGRFAINTNSSPKVITIDDEYRKSFTLNANRILDNTDLNTLVKEIKRQHSIALYWKRNYLTTNILAALNARGASTNIDSNGFISASNTNGNEYKIWATPRPPKVNDYHYSDISNPVGEKVIVGPDFIEEKRQTLNSWISEKSIITFYNEGQIQDLSKFIYP